MLRFKQGEIPKFAFAKALKKPIPIRCIQIDEPFEVETMEGVMTAKKGDWLMIGIDGEMYACDQVIFNKTYEIIQST